MVCIMRMSEAIGVECQKQWPISVTDDTSMGGGGQSFNRYHHLFFLPSLDSEVLVHLMSSKPQTKSMSRLFPQ